VVTAFLIVPNLDAVSTEIVIFMLFQLLLNFAIVIGSLSNIFFFYRASEGTFAVK
jgi:hypothetical protein